MDFTSAYVIASGFAFGCYLIGAALTKIAKVMDRPLFPKGFVMETKVVHVHETKKEE